MLKRKKKNFQIKNVHLKEQEKEGVTRPKRKEQQRPQSKDKLVTGRIEKPRENERNRARNLWEDGQSGLLFSQTRSKAVNC